MKKSNAELQTDVYEELRWDSRVTEADIGVSVIDGIVTLSGFIPSYAEKWAAEDACKRVVGVSAVVNNIEVNLAGAHVLNDHEIAAAAEHALKWNVWIADDSVKIVVEKGWVTLSGSVLTQYQRSTAESAIRALTGVRGVTNRINLKPKANACDVKEQIKKALRRHADAEAKGISISVNGGTVELTGVVNSKHDRDEAVWAAWATAGVSQVKNNLAIVV